MSAAREGEKRRVAIGQPYREETSRNLDRLAADITVFNTSFRIYFRISIPEKDLSIIWCTGRTVLDFEAPTPKFLDSALVAIMRGMAAAALVSRQLYFLFHLGLKFGWQIEYLGDLVMGIQ
jgi:hypothetical protein